jgi:hypothetical protein
VKYVLDTKTVSALMTGDAAAIERLSRVSRQDARRASACAGGNRSGIERLSESRRKDVLRDRLTLLRSELPRVDWSGPVAADALVV